MLWVELNRKRWLDDIKRFSIIRGLQSGSAQSMEPSGVSRAKFMENFETTNLKRSIETLSGHSGDKLRAAQKFMANLASIPEQEQSFQYVIQVFTELTQPQRLTLLRTIQTHLERDQYTCLAIIPNKFIIEHVLDRLKDEITKKEGILFKQEAHGSKEEISRLADLIEDIKTKIAEISIKEKDLHISQKLQAFLATLTDNQFARLIIFITRMRDIKACRDRFQEVVDEDYIAKQLGEKDDGFLELNINKDFLQFLRETDRSMVAEMTKMDFQELTMLVDALEEIRSKKYTQGQTK